MFFGYVRVLDSEGCYLAHTVRQAGFALPKGRKLTEADVGVLVTGVQKVTLSKSLIQLGGATASRRVSRD